MSRNARVLLPGCAFHITQRGSNRQPVFRTIADRKVYLDLVQDNLASAGVRLLAYCLMTNHVHMVAIPERGDSLNVLMRRVHGRYAQYFNAKSRRSGHLWQARFFSCPLSPQHLAVALRYVELNPVRACMVERAECYRWSSAAGHLDGKLGFLDREEWESRGSAEGWKELLAGPTRQPVIHLLRRCTYGGRPFGGADFVAEVEAKLNLHWKRWTYDQELRNQDLVLSLDALDAPGVREGDFTRSAHG